MSMNPTAGTVTVVNADNTTSQLAAGSALIDNNWLHHWPATGNPRSVPAFRVMSCVWDEDPGVTDEAVIVAERDQYRAALELIANSALTWSATQDRARLRQIAADALAG